MKEVNIPNWRKFVCGDCGADCSMSDTEIEKCAIERSQEYGGGR